MGLWKSVRLKWLLPYKLFTKAEPSDFRDITQPLRIIDRVRLNCAHLNFDN